MGYSPKGHKELDMTEQLSMCSCMHACARAHTHTHTFPLGAFLVELVVKNLPANAGDAGEVGLIPWLGRSPGWADPLGEEMVTHASIRAWKSHGQGSLVGYSPWGRTDSDMTEAT